jgi:hypothetical protein
MDQSSASPSPSRDLILGEEYVDRDRPTSKVLSEHPVMEEVGILFMNIISISRYE